MVSCEGFILLALLSRFTCSINIQVLSEPVLCARPRNRDPQVTRQIGHALVGPQSHEGGSMVQPGWGISRVAWDQLLSLSVPPFLS